MKIFMLERFLVAFSCGCLLPCVGLFPQQDFIQEIPFYLPQQEIPVVKKCHIKSKRFGKKNKRNIIITSKKNNVINISVGSSGSGTQGPQGPIGPAGSLGPQGATGATGLSNITVVDGYLTITFMPVEDSGLTGAWHLEVVFPDGKKFVDPTSFDLQTGPFTRQTFIVPTAPPLQLQVGTYAICAVSEGITGGVDGIGLIEQMNVQNSVDSRIASGYPLVDFSSSQAFLLPGDQLQSHYTTTFAAP